MAPNKEEEKVLQAVIIADSFNTRFDPISWELPRALFPLVNVPLIDYTLELLSTAKIQEVFIFVRCHADKLREHIKNSKYNGPLTIQIVEAQDATSLGDALREFDSKNLINEDFVLLWGDSVSNMNLAGAIEEHQKRRQTNKKAICTVVLKEANPFDRSRERCEGAVFAYDPATFKILSYHPVEEESKPFDLEIGIETLKATTNLRFDLMVGGVEICSKEVLALFTENFDYQSFGKDFICGVLSSDILDAQIYCKILSNSEYATRVRSTHLYDSISQDIIQRWTYPVVPDIGLFTNDCVAPYCLHRNNVYLADNLILSRTMNLKNNVVIGRGSHIGENVLICKSVIGQNVKIGSNVKIENSYIWDDCIIEDNCTIQQSILANGVTIKPNSTVARGCLISFNCTLGPNAKIPEFTRITKCLQTIPDISDLKLNESDHESNYGIGRPIGSSFTKPSSVANKELLGVSSDCHIYQPENEDCDSEELEKAIQIGHPYHKERPDLITCLACERMEESEIDSEVDEVSNFAREAYETMKGAIQQNHSIDNALLELNGLKFACNATFKDMRSVIVNPILDTIDYKNVANSIQKGFAKWVVLLGKISPSIGEQVEILHLITDYLTVRSFTKSIGFILPILYKFDVVEEDAISLWFHQLSGSQSEIKEQAKKFVEWLEESEDEDEEDDEEDSE